MIFFKGIKPFKCVMRLPFSPRVSVCVFVHLCLITMETLVYTDANTVLLHLLKMTEVGRAVNCLGKTVEIKRGKN